MSNLISKTMPVCSNFDCQVRTLSQLSLWVKHPVIGGWWRVQSSRLRRGCKYLPAPAIENGRELNV